MTAETKSLLNVFAAFAEKSFEEIWPAVLALEASDPPSDACAELASRLQDLEERARVAAAKFLRGRSDRALAKRGDVAVFQLAREARDRDVRKAAIRLLGDPLRENRESAYLVLKGVADSTPDPELRIEATLSLWRIDNYPPTRKPLLELLASGVASERYAAALALAETGYFEKRILQVLEEIRSEPTERGRRARLYLELHAATTAAPGPGLEGPRPANSGVRPAEPRGPTHEEAQPGSPPESALEDWSRAVQEVAREILRSSAYAKNLTLGELYVAALKGMVSAVDEYSAFLDPKDLHELETGQLGSYLGLGAQFAQSDRNAPLVVSKVYPSGPAREAGLRVGDQVLELNGVPTPGTSIDRLRSLAASGERSILHLRIRRWDEVEPRDVWVRLGEVEVPAVYSELLPGKIGYLRILRFGAGTAAEFEKLLDRLEASAVVALILDLRDNAGGRLDEAVKIVDFFLGAPAAEACRPIVTEKTLTKEEARYPDPQEKPFHPLFVIVNRGTASAAEVVAAALQDFGRATIVGEPTYGKGVKQTSIPVSPRLQRLLGGEGRLLLTTSWLYSPLGRPLQRRPAKAGVEGWHGGGVVPDIRTPGGVRASAEEKRTREDPRIDYSPQVADFLRKHRERVIRDAASWDPAAEDDFGDLVARLSSPLPPEEIAARVRRTALRYAQGDRDERAEARLKEDADLRTAFLEALRKTGQDPASLPFDR